MQPMAWTIRWTADPVMINCMAVVEMMSYWVGPVRMSSWEKMVATFCPEG